MSATNKRNNYGNFNDNSSNNNTIGDDCMNIKGEVDVNLEKGMPGSESNESTNSDLELSEEEDEFDMELESFTENDVEDAVVDQFVKWMASVDGGNCSVRSAKQHAVAVKLIYSYVKDGDCSSYNQICEKHLVRDKWLTVFLNEK